MFCALVGAIGEAEILASRQSVLHMETAPLPIVDGGTPTAPVRSLYQTDSIGLKLRVELAWGLRANGAIAWTQGVTW
jgi:hypothetical protein